MCKTESLGKTHCYTTDFKKFDSIYLECGNTDDGLKWLTKECPQGTSCIENGKAENEILCGTLMDQAKALRKW